jgi:hypothetical protein
MGKTWVEAKGGSERGVAFEAEHIIHHIQKMRKDQGFGFSHVKDGAWRHPDIGNCGRQEPQKAEIPSLIAHKYGLMRADILCRY